MSDDINKNDDFAEFKPDQPEQENNDNLDDVPKESTDSDENLSLENNPDQPEEMVNNDQTVDSQPEPEEQRVEIVVDQSRQSVTDIDEDSRLICAICHIGNVIAPFTLISGFVGALIYFLKEEEIIRFQAKQAVIVNLLWIAINIVVSIPLFLLSAICCITFPLLIFPWFTLAILSIYVSVKVYQGNNYRLPYVADWAEKINI